ncbi:hypothetical protein MauCBS54593_006354 [Microsporum audouinii]
MPNKIQPQVDAGQLSLQGLGLFSPLLAALSADDVNPVAMIQMERLGAAFPVNGQYASKVPDYLPRFTSTRLNRIGLIIGWWKDDAASYIVKTEIFNSPISVASSVQLRRVAKYLSSKHSVIGFGNILATNVGRVHSAYRHLQKPMPTDSRYGKHPCLHIWDPISELYFVMVMFPQDTVVSVNNVIIREGKRKLILIEFDATVSVVPAEITMETVVAMSASNTACLPITASKQGSSGIS